MKLEQRNIAPQDQIDITSAEQHKPVDFPTSRYFQIHFEYLDTQIDEVRRMLQDLHLQLGELTQRMAKDATRLHKREPRPLSVESGPRKSPRPRSAASGKSAPPRG